MNRNAPGGSWVTLWPSCPPASVQKSVELRHAAGQLAGRGIRPGGLDPFFQHFPVQWTVFE